MLGKKTLGVAFGAATMLACTAGAVLAAPDIGCSDADDTKALAFAAAALVTDDKSELDDIHLKKDAYKVDEPLSFFLVPAGYACEQGGTKAVFAMSIQLWYQGRIVADQPNAKSFDFSEKIRIKNIRINMDDKISGLVPGAFALRVTLVDQIGDRSAEVILPFGIAP